MRFVFVRTQHHHLENFRRCSTTNGFQAVTEACVGEPAGDPLGDQRHDRRRSAAPLGNNLVHAIRAFQHADEHPLNRQESGYALVFHGLNRDIRMLQNTFEP
jgi:hypothetical protein